MFLLSLREKTSSYTIRDHHHLHYLITAFIHLLILLKLSYEPHTSDACRLTYLKCSCICSPQYTNQVMGANISSNTYLPQKRAAGKQHTWIYHIPVSSPGMLLSHNSILWCSAKLLLWYEMNIIYVPTDFYVFIFLVYIYSESPYCPFRYTLWSYAVSPNRMSFTKEQPEELSNNWNNTKLSQGKGRLRLPVPSYHSN